MRPETITYCRWDPEEKRWRHYRATINRAKAVYENEIETDEVGTPTNEEHQH